MIKAVKEMVKKLERIMGESSSLLKANEGKEEVTEPMKKWLLCQRKGENLG